MRDDTGFLSVILHAHLPFVKHPEVEDCLPERWLFQAMTECYLPLLRVFRRLLRDGVDYRVTVSLSPPLMEMLADPLLKDRYCLYLEKQISLGEKEISRLRGDRRLEGLARMYVASLESALRDFSDLYRQDLLGAWDDLAKTGAVELITSAGTHGYLPLLLSTEAIAAQVRTGLESYHQHFDRSSPGFWLPECAYCPEVLPYLVEGGVNYTVLETHGILLANPRPAMGFHAPVMIPGGPAAFGRDPDCSKQVWSAEEGYPGDGTYREFYRDIGYELPIEYLGDALPGETRVPTAFKYYRVTDRRSQHKELYDPTAAASKAEEHARNFLFWRIREAEHYGALNGRPPIMVAPYDAELFGHWWYEGPLFLESLFRAMAESQVTAVTPSGYLERYPTNQVAEPARSSWGYKGYSEVWLEGSNDWIYRHLHACQDRMSEAIRNHPGTRGLSKRALNQAVREILLAQSSDWPFIMKTGTVPLYAKQRFAAHVDRFTELLNQVEEGMVDPAFLFGLEKADSIFAGADLSSSWRDTATL